MSIYPRLRIPDWDQRARGSDFGIGAKQRGSTRTYPYNPLFGVANQIGGYRLDAGRGRAPALWIQRHLLFDVANQVGGVAFLLGVSPSS